MLIKKSVLKIISICTAGVIIPTAVIGGYFVISEADRYRGLYTNPANDGTSAMVSAYRGAVLQGAEIIMAPGFTHGTPITTAFKEVPDFFKNTGFLFFDDAISGASRAAANTWNITYRADLGSIQVGIAAAYFLNLYQDTFLEDGNLTYAMWGGLNFSSVTSFMGGFQQGIEWANKELAGKDIGTPAKKYVQVQALNKVTGKNYDSFTGGFGPSNGINIMQQIIADKPDILMPVAGPQVWTASSIISSINSKTILVGVDSAVEDDPRNTDINFTSNGEKIGNGKRVQFSSLKNLARSAETVLKIINNGNKVPEDKVDQERYSNFASNNGQAGGIGGYGTIAVGDSKNGNVGISTAGKVFFEKALGLVYPDVADLSTVDPSILPIYSTVDKMFFTDNAGIKWHYDKDAVDPKTGNKIGLRLEFQDNNSSGINTLNTKGIIQKGDQKAVDKFKIILSSAGSILMDASFSQSCYVGLYTYLKSEGINIPPAVGG